MNRTFLISAISAALLAGAAAGAQERVTIPILVPVTGALALEGQSQRNGALLGLETGLRDSPASPVFRGEVIDTGSNPQLAVQAFERAFGASPKPRALMGPIDGNSMLALLPLAEREGAVLLSVSGTARLTELGNRYIFRFFPSDAVVKAAQARYIVEELKRTKVALIHQNTAYGQSGEAELSAWFKRLGASVVYRNSLPVTTKELAGVIAQVRDSGADVVALQLHSGSSALFVRQASRAGLGLPIVGGSALHQPSTAALLEPSELKGVCAETASAPAADHRNVMKAFTDAYRKRFNAEPDAFAVAAYDAVDVVKRAWSSPSLRDALAGIGTPNNRYIEGVAMKYANDGKGNMAHDAIIVCYEGTGRTPRIAKHYSRPHDAARR
jgi:branched-chain amino acid transport system substrate-binding protein